MNTALKFLRSVLFLNTSYYSKQNSCRYSHSLPVNAPVYLYNIQLIILSVSQDGKGFVYVEPIQGGWSAGTYRLP